MMHRRDECFCRRLALALAVAAAACTTGAAEDWAQFRGPNCTGVSLESRNLPVKFSHEDKVVWSAEIGKGIACPIIANNRLFATTMTADGKFAVIGYDAADGTKLWQTEYEAGKLPEITPPNTHASATPTSDGERVYAYFSTVGIVALDASSGDELWRHPLPMPVYLLGWGPANSPILHGDRLIFNLDDDLNPYLLALNKKTGEPLWRTPRPEMLGGYAVPVIVESKGRTDIVVAGSGKLKGYDPETGKELWTCNSLLRTIMTTPAVAGDRVFISVQSYGDTSRVLKYALLQWRDTNQDGKLEKSELEKNFWEKFDKGDADKDGFLVDNEIDDAFQAKTNRVGGGNIVQAVRAGGNGDVTQTHLVWNLDNKSPSNIASPLAVDGRLFVVKKGGISACFSTENGETLWMKKRIRNLGNYYASPIAGDGKIYVTGENGYIVVLEQGPKLKILAKNDLAESCVATPAIANDRLYVRTLNRLYCFAESAK